MKEIINGLWIGRSLTLMEQLSIASFLQNGYEYHLYCYDEMANVPAGTILRDAVEILPASEIFYYQQGEGKGSVAAFANLFRYKLLLEKGGWWADTDMVCLRPFDFVEPIVFASERTDIAVQTANAILKLPRGHAVARLCYEAAKRENRAKLTWGKTGPLLIDRIIREKGLQHFIKAPDVFCPVNYLEWQSFLAVKSRPLEQLITNESRAVHLWHEMWRRAGIKWETAGADATPFAELLRKYGVQR